MRHLLVALGLLLGGPAVASGQKAEAVFGEKDLIPLDAVMVTIEDQPILASQVQAQLQLLRTLAGKDASTVTPEAAQRALVEGRLIGIDAKRRHLEIQDADVDRLLDMTAARQGLKNGRELLDAAQKFGLDERTYRAYIRQELVEARWEALYRSTPEALAMKPPPTRAQGVAELEAEMVIDRPQGLTNRQPGAQRTCLPKSPPQAPAAQPPKEREVVALCIEGAASSESEAQLTRLQRFVRLQAPLSQDAVARSLGDIVESQGGAEAAAAYALPVRPGGDPRGPLLVVYRLQPRPLLSAIELEGAPQGVALPPIAVPAGTRYFHYEVHNQLDSTLMALQDAGYLHANAHAERLPRKSDSEPVRMHVKLLPGPRTYVAQLALPGVAAARLAEIQALVGLRAGDPVSESKLVEGRDKISQYYSDRGFLKAYVERHVTEAAPVRADGSPQITVKMAITEGKPYKLGTIKLAGALPLSESELRKLIKTQRGALFRPDAMRADLNRMIEAGKQHGKPVAIDPATSINDATSTIDLTLTFSPQAAPPK